MSKGAVPVAEISRQKLDAMIRKIAGRGGAAAGLARPAVADEPIPASFAQRRLWFLDRLEPGSAVYNMPLGLRLEAHERAALADLQQYFARHLVGHDVG